MGLPSWAEGNTDAEYLSCLLQRFSLAAQLPVGLRHQNDQKAGTRLLPGSRFYYPPQGQGIKLQGILHKDKFPTIFAIWFHSLDLSSLFPLFLNKVKDSDGSANCFGHRDTLLFSKLLQGSGGFLGQVDVQPDECGFGVSFG
jgi:hypothetical protein